MSHHEMNGSLTSPGAYASLHNIPPQMSAAAAAAAAAYGRSPMVSFGAVRRPFGSFLGDWARCGELVGVEGCSPHAKGGLGAPQGLEVRQLTLWGENVSETIET